MSLRRWLKKSDSTTSDQGAFRAAEEAIEVAQQEIMKLGKRGRKRKSTGERHYFDSSMKTAIGKYAILNGNKKTVEKFTVSLNHAVSEATVRNFKKEVQKQLKDGKILEDIEISSKKRGRPLLLPEEIDELTKQFVQNLRACGSPVSSSIVLAAARGIVTHKASSLLKEHGGPIELKKSWAFSFLSRHGYVKRKATRTSRKVPTDLDTVKASFLDKIKEVITTNNIPPSMVLNFDQTGTKMVPVSDWILEVQGSRQIDMVGLDDKREVTVLLAVSLSGELLPPQVIYAGKTTRCHPNVNIPAGWHVAHSQSHWSTRETMLEYIDTILAPYMVKQRQHLMLPPDAVGLCIFDVFAAHRCEDVLQKLSDASIKYVFVPAGCTGQLQPLDVAVNEPFKGHLKELFSSWYSQKVKERLDNGESIEHIKVDLRMSMIKPVHFQWLIQNHTWLSQQEGALIRGWKDTGILDKLGEDSTLT